MTLLETFAFQAPFGIETIKKIIPHRPPFLLVDGVTELGEDYIRGFKCLSINEPYFAGHFPHLAVYPGVLQIESLAQVGACWILSRRENMGKTAFLMSVETAKFRRPVVPGDRLDLYGRITNLKSRTGRFVGEAHVNGQLTAEATVFFAFQKNDTGGSQNGE